MLLGACGAHGSPRACSSTVEAFLCTAEHVLRREQKRHQAERGLSEWRGVEAVRLSGFRLHKLLLQGSLMVI